MLGRRYRLGGPLPRNLSGQKAAVVHSINRKILQGIYTLESVACCICGEHDADLLSERDRHGVRSSVVICRACGRVRTSPRPTAQSYAQYYSEEYYGLEYGADDPGEPFFRSQCERGRGIFEYLARAASLPPAGSRVLEVGCSSGGILSYFRDRGYAVRGVDLSEPFTQYGKRRHGLDLAVGTVGQVAAAYQPGLIIYSHTFEHVLDPDAELAAVRALLPRTGVLYIQVPGIKYLRRGYLMDFLAYVQFAHTYHFSLTTLTNLLARNGFALVAGDESVNAVFRQGAPAAAFVPRNDHDATVAYLKNAERLRPLHRFLTAAIRAVRRAYQRVRGVSNKEP
ncbi:MAG: class I SAM-dependent methyltransferase [Nevskiaceae bacterium]